jgi:hypothetical protein
MFNIISHLCDICSQTLRGLQLKHIYLSLAARQPEALTTIGSLGAIREQADLGWTNKS